MPTSFKDRCASLANQAVRRFRIPDRLPEPDPAEQTRRLEAERRSLLQEWLKAPAAAFMFEMLDGYIKSAKRTRQANYLVHQTQLVFQGREDGFEELRDELRSILNGSPAQADTIPGDYNAG